MKVKVIKLSTSENTTSISCDQVKNQYKSNYVGHAPHHFRDPQIAHAYVDLQTYVKSSNLWR